jgi:hypothetical protein
VPYGPDSAPRLAHRSSEKGSLYLNFWIHYTETQNRSHAENVGQHRAKRSPTYDGRLIEVMDL